LVVSLFLQGYVIGAVLEVSRVLVGSCPAVTVWLAGWVVIDGAAAAALTVSVAALLVILPAVLLTATVNCELLSAEVVAGVVYLDKVAPLMVVLFFLHW